MSESPASQSGRVLPVSPPRRERSEEQLNQAAADRELMRKLQSGDEDAFASFYRRFSPGLFSMIYKILLDQKESEDVLQEAFVQMWKKASTYDAQRSGLFTWAVMISRNKAIDRLRSRQRRSRAVEAAAAELEAVPPEGGEQADTLLSQRDERSRVRAALTRTPQIATTSFGLSIRTTSNRWMPVPSTSPMPAQRTFRLSRRRISNRRCVRGELGTQRRRSEGGSVRWFCSGSDRDGRVRLSRS